MVGTASIEGNISQAQSNTVQYFIQGLAIKHLGVGSHTLQFRFSYGGPQASSYVKAVDLHVSGVTPNA